MEPHMCLMNGKLTCQISGLLWYLFKVEHWLTGSAKLSGGLRRGENLYPLRITEHHRYYALIKKMQYSTSNKAVQQHKAEFSL